MKNTLRSHCSPAALAKHFMILLIFSFLGWLWETVYVSYLAGELVDRGFFFTPVCPIYGSCLLALYFLLGTPDNPQGLLRKFQNRHGRYMIYLLFAGIVPTAVELVVGVFFHQLFDVRLWTYEANPYNFYGYICLYNSLFWAVGITVLMRFVYPAVQNMVFRLKDRTALRIAMPMLVLLAADGIISFLLLLL